MGKPILSVMHGTGVNKSGWNKEVKDSFQTAMTYYPILKDKKLSSIVKIVPITYDGSNEPFYENNI